MSKLKNNITETDITGDNTCVWTEDKKAEDNINDVWTEDNIIEADITEDNIDVLTENNITDVWNEDNIHVFETDITDDNTGVWTEDNSIEDNIIDVLTEDNIEKNLKQSWLPAFWKKIQNTQEVKEKVFWLDKTGQNVRIFKELLFFRATYNI